MGQRHGQSPAPRPRLKRLTGEKGHPSRRRFHGRQPYPRRRRVGDGLLGRIERTPAGGAAPAGADGTSAAAAAGASSAAAAANSAAGNSGSSGSTANFNVCTALTAAQVSQITGTTFATTKPDGTDGQVFGCDYATGDSALLQVSVTVKDGKIGYDADLNALTTAGFPPNTVTGVGDQAFSAPDPKGNAGSVGASAFASYGTIFGNVYIQIGGLTYVTPRRARRSSRSCTPSSERRPRRLALGAGQAHAPSGRREGERSRVRVHAVADGDDAGLVFTAW